MVEDTSRHHRDLGILCEVLNRLMHLSLGDLQQVLDPPTFVGACGADGMTFARVWLRAGLQHSPTPTSARDFSSRTTNSSRYRIPISDYA